MPLSVEEGYLSHNQVHLRGYQQAALDSLSKNSTIAFEKGLGKTVGGAVPAFQYEAPSLVSPKVLLAIVLTVFVVCAIGLAVSYQGGNAWDSHQLIRVVHAIHRMF